MAQLANSNSFALLYDDDVDDVSTFLDRVAEKAKNSLVPAVENKQNQKQRPSRHLQPSGSVKDERWRGRGDQGHGAGRFGHGRNEVEKYGNDHANLCEQNSIGSDGHQRNYREWNEQGSGNQLDNGVKNSYQPSYGGEDGYQRKYEGEDDYQHKYRGEDGYQRNYGGEDGYQRNYGGEDGYQRNYGGQDGYQRNYGGMNDSQWNNSSDSYYGDDDVRNAGNHNGNGCGRGSGSDENNASGYDEAIDSQQNPIQDGTDESGWELVNEFQGQVRGSEGQILKDEHGRAGSDRRVYGGGNSNFSGREGHSYDDNSWNDEWNPPPSTLVEKDTEPKHGNHETEYSSENVREGEENVIAQNMTLEEYEKQFLEKRKALEAMKNSGERKVIVDKDFESMQLVDKKNEDDSHFIKLNSEKDKLKKKDILDKEEKVRKSVSISEFLKPADGEMPVMYTGRWRGGRGRGRGERGRFRGSFPRQRGRGDATPALEDPDQFPSL